MIISVLVIIAIVGICVAIFSPKKERGVKITCDHCFHQLTLNTQSHKHFVDGGKICPNCKKCVNK